MRHPPRALCGRRERRDRCQLACDPVTGLARLLPPHHLLCHSWPARDITDMATTRSDFEQLVIRHQHVVCAVAYAVLRDRGRSEEVAQEAFLVAWQRLPELRSPPAMPGWLCGIARNLARNASRRHRVRERASGSPAIELRTPLADLLDREQEQLAARAFEQLGEADREAIVLYYFVGESTGTLADALGISHDAARQRVHRGRAALRDAIDVVERSLRSKRPGVAFTIACVAALTARSAAPAAASTTALITKSLLVKLAVAGGVAGATYGVVIVATPVGASDGVPVRPTMATSPPPSPPLSGLAIAAGESVHVHSITNDWRLTIKPPCEHFTYAVDRWEASLLGGEIIATPQLGTTTYRVRCSDGGEYAGTIGYVRDRADRPVASRRLANSITADGRTWIVSSGLDTVAVRFRGQSEDERLVIADARDGHETSYPGNQTVLDLAVGTRARYWFVRHDGTRSPVSTLTIEADRGAPLLHLARTGDDVVGALLPDCVASIDGVTLTLDARHQFHARLVAPRTIVRVVSPQLGTHLFVIDR